MKIIYEPFFYYGSFINVHISQTIFEQFLCSKRMDDRIQVTLNNLVLLKAQDVFSKLDTYLLTYATVDPISIIVEVQNL